MVARYRRPGASETERQRNVHRDVRFLRGIVGNLVHTGDWSGCSADEQLVVDLWLGVDGVPPGLKISWVLLVDPPGAEGGVWEHGRSPAGFYWACRSRLYM